MAKDLLAGKTNQPRDLLAKPISTGRALAVGAGQGATLGFGDEVAGVLTALRKISLGDKRNIVDIYKEERDKARGEVTQAKEQHPIASGLGELGGAGATMLIPGVGGAKLATLGAKAIQGAKVGGALSGAMALGGATGTPVEQAKRTALGAGLGAVGGGATSALIGGVQSYAGGKSIDAGRKALGYTKPMLKGEEKFNRATKVTKTAIKENIVSAGPFNATEKTLNNAQDLADRSGETIGRIRGELANSGVSVLKPTKLISDIEKQLGSEYVGGAYTKEAEILKEINETIEAHLSGKRINFKSAVDLVQKLQKEGKFTGVGGSDPVNRRAEMFQRASGIASDKLDDAVKTAGRVLKKPELIKEYVKAKDLYGQSQDMLIGLYGKRAAEQGNNEIGLRQAMLAAGLFASGRAPEALLAVIIPGITKGAAQGMQAKLGARIAQSAALPAGRYLPLGVGATIK